MSQDPIGLLGGVNGYVYSELIPNLYVDPLGLETMIIFGQGVGTNPFGHSALAFTNQGVYSYGTAHPFGSSIITILDTTPEQEKAMIEAMKSSSKNYDVLTNNCATTNINALKAGGIEPSAINIPFLPITVRDIGWAQPKAKSYFLPTGSDAPNFSYNFDQKHE